MDQEAATPEDVQRLALLIGINHYLDGTARNVTLPPLAGCVRDVTRMKKYLVDTLKVPTDNIVMLTSTLNPETGKVVEPKSHWPTRNNIVHRVREMHMKARKNALLYIHYSGHGMLREKIAQKTIAKENPEGDDDLWDNDDFSGGDSFSGAALVPMDVRDGGAYLTAYQLGFEIEKMVRDADRKLRVIVVLDCCHSGHFRDADEEEEDDDSEVREAYEEEYQQLPADQAAEAEMAQEDDETRGAELEKLPWLDDPYSCTVMAACGALEKAREIRFGRTPDARGGALTHWMLDILQRYPPGRPPTYERIRNHVVTKVEGWLPRHYQTPRVVGDNLHEFFGHNFLSPPAASAIFKRNGQYILRSGRAQGVAPGAVYELQSEGWAWEGRGGDAVHPLQLRVTETVSDLRSVVEPVSPKNIASINKWIDHGYRAVRRSWALPRQVIVTVAAGTPGPDASYLEDKRLALERHLESTPGFVVKLGDDTVHPHGYNVMLSKKEVVRILDGGGTRIPRVPNICLAHVGGMERLADTLNHIARFQSLYDNAYGGPVNTHRLTPARFHFAPYDILNELLPRGSTPTEYHATEDQKITIRFSVRDDENSVRVAIFNLDESWGVRKVFPKLGVAPEELRGGDLPIEYPLTMTIRPDAAGTAPSPIREKLRAYVYAGSRVPDWDEVHLKALSTEPTSPPKDLKFFDDDYDRAAEDREVWGAADDGKWTVLDFTIVTSPAA